MASRVRLAGVSLRYRARRRSASFKGTALQWVRRGSTSEAVVALDGIDFAADAGEMIGLVGPNGAGKSSLLKVIGGVLTPTNGHVEVHGIVTPVLDVAGAGDPELTGVENIVLLGLLLGRSRREIEDAREEIVDFAGIRDVAGATLASYSTGMRQRLLLGVAMTWRPDILLLDEALASGDAAFTATCLARAREFADAGTCVIVASHDAALVARASRRVVWLERGAIRHDAAAGTVLEAYGATAGW
jgi:ABC-type polysaccharide/polyol phosphate transport system ATPase subunit